MGLDATCLEAALAKLRGEVVENLDVVSDTLSIVRRIDGHVSEDFAVDDVPSVGIRQSRRRPFQNSSVNTDGI